MGGILGRAVKGAATSTAMLRGGNVEECSIETCNKLNNPMQVLVGTVYWWEDGKCMMGGRSQWPMVLCQGGGEEF